MYRHDKIQQYDGGVVENHSHFVMPVVFYHAYVPLNLRYYQLENHRTCISIYHRVWQIQPIMLQNTEVVESPSSNFNLLLQLYRQPILIL